MYAKNVKRQSGFTLIELMVAVAIVAILAAVALPAYTSYVNRSRITDAMAGLADYRIRMEQWFQDNRSYGTAGSACSSGGGPAAPPANNFTIGCVVGTPNTSYTITATNTFGTVGDYVYTLNEQNARGTTKYKGATVSKSCWLIRGTEC